MKRILIALTLCMVALPASAVDLKEVAQKLIDSGSILRHKGEMIQSILTSREALHLANQVPGNKYSYIRLRVYTQTGDGEVIAEDLEIKADEKGFSNFNAAIDIGLRNLQADYTN